MSDGSTPRTAEIAAAWAIRLATGELDEAARFDLDAWLCCDPAHRAALEAAQRAWRIGGLTEIAKGMAIARQRRRIPALIAAVAAAAFMGFGVYWAIDVDAADYAAPPDRSARIALSDGTHILLDRGAAVKVRFGRFGRRVEIERGRVEFSVAHDARAFVAALDRMEVGALGTRFVIVDDGENKTALLTEGAVRVSDPEGMLRPVVLKPGDMARRTPTRFVVIRPDLAIALGWTTERLVFRDVTIAEAASALAARSGATIVMRSQLAFRARVSGAFHERDVPGFLAALQQVHPVAWTQTGPNRFEVRDR